MNLVSAVKFLELLEEKKIRIDMCAPSKDLSVKPWSKLDKKSASPSEQFFSEMAASALGKMSLPISIKLFPNNPNESGIAGLVYEANVYKKIIDTILTRKESPNFVAYITSACCPIKNKQEEENLKRSFQPLFPGKDLSKGVCVVITEKVGSGISFGVDAMCPVSSLASIYPELKKIDSKAILFQIFYSLYVLQKYRINHNDLHGGNILVLQLPKPVRLGFKIEKRQYLIETRFIPYIFDWDFSYCESLGNNPKTQSLVRWASYNTFSEKRDIYTLLCNLEEEKFSKRIGSHIAKYKEHNLTIPLNFKQLEYVKKFRPMYDNVYKFGGNQLKELFFNLSTERRMKGIFEEFITGLFVLSEENSSLVFYNPHGCTMTVASENFPTPLQGIDKLGKFEFKGELELQTELIYTAPSSGEAKKIIIDPQNRGKGRRELERLGIKPRFPLKNSGYVRVRTKQS